MICDKVALPTPGCSEDRLTMPLLRKGEQLVPVSWQEALQYVADRLRSIKRQHGPDAVGGIGSAKLSNESNYLLQRFMRQIVGTNNIDHRDGGDVAALPTGLPALADIMKPQYGPNPQVDTVLLFGIDPSEELPILDLHLKRAVRRGGVKLVIAHPRKVELTRYGGPYLGYRPGSEATLLNGLVKAALAAGGKDNAKQPAPKVTDEDLAQICGVDPADVKAAAEHAGSERSLILYGPMAARRTWRRRGGLNSLALVTGNAQRLAMPFRRQQPGLHDMGILPTGCRATPRS